MRAEYIWRIKAHDLTMTKSWQQGRGLIWRITFISKLIPEVQETGAGLMVSLDRRRHPMLDALVECHLMSTSNQALLTGTSGQANIMVARPHSLCYELARVSEPSVAFEKTRLLPVWQLIVRCTSWHRCKARGEHNLY